MDPVIVVLSEEVGGWFVDSYSRRGNALYDTFKQFGDRNTAMAYALKWCAIIVDMLDTKQVTLVIRKGNGDEDEIVLKDE